MTTRTIGQHVGKWTPERIKIAVDHLAEGKSLSQTAKEMGINRMSLTKALERNNIRPKKVWKL